MHSAEWQGTKNLAIPFLRLVHVSLFALMDNFEWSEGFRQRFGLIHMDYRTGKRTLKDSARWYRQVIAGNGASIPSPASP